MERTYSGLVEEVIMFIGVLIPAIFALLFLFFVWKILDAWVINAAEPTKRDEGKKYAIAAFVAFIAMIGVWSFVQILRDTLFGLA